MQRREYNHASIELANNQDMSGKGTADEINRSYRIGKERSVWCIASLSFLGTLAVAGFFAALVPLPARADDEESRHGHGNDKGIRVDIAALQAQVAALQHQVNTLQSQLATVQSNNALLLGPFVTVDPNPEIGVIGPNIVFSGANIHIVSGSGATNDNSNFKGLGNLIIGYDEDPSTAVNAGAGVAPGPLPPLAPGDRGGSHNLVIGRWNRFPSAFGGFVAGEGNTILGAGTSVSGGGANTAGGTDVSVSGGRFNTAGGFYSSVSGGESNTAAGFNPGFGFGASVSGGVGNTASGTDASVCGGEGNTAFDNASTVTGGTGNNAGSFITFQEGIGASVLGGTGNNAGGRNSVVIGSQNIIDNKDLSIAPQPPFP
jgi:trimeric autotransporter adhesin